MSQTTGRALLCSRLIICLRECSDDLAAEIDARYDSTRHTYPSEQRRYERDMASVLKARALLAEVKSVALDELGKLDGELL